MKKISKIVLSVLLVIGMLVTSLQGSTVASADVSEENPMRALWLRPKQTTKAQVEAVVEKIADAGINTIFLETVYDGYTIFPVEYDATYQRPLFNGFDVLQAYIDACHSRGIQLHCWVESFFIGMEYVDAGGPVYKAHKDWLLTDNSGNNWEDTMYGKMYFFNPAREECREWIVGLYEILVENYDIDGIQLDYVRYPQKTSSVDWGYDEYTINKFIEEKGFDPTNAEEGSYEAQVFVQFKQNQVTEFVKACSENLKAINPDLILSLSVYPFYQDGKNLFMQSAELWMSEGYGDLVVPMAYYENQIDSITKNTINVAGGSEKNVVIGISAQNGFTVDSLSRQANAVLDKGVGVAFFEYESFFNGGYANALKSGVLSDTQFNIDPEVYKSSVDVNAKDEVKGYVTFVNGYDWTATGGVEQVYAYASENTEASISTITGQQASTYAWWYTVILEQNDDGNYVVKSTGVASINGAISEGLGEGKIILMAHDSTTAQTENLAWLKSLALDDVLAMNVEWAELAAISASAPATSIYFAEPKAETPEDPEEPEEPHTHENVIHMEAVEPGCHYLGNVEYWYCPGCEGFWTDEALTQVTNSKSVILPATGEGNVVHMEAVEPDCHFDGNIEYWVCYDCEQVWQDEALTQLTNIKNVVVPATGSENLVHYEAVEPGCHYNGCIEYWYCPECEQVWQDEALTQLTNVKNIVVPATGGDVVHMEAVEPGCHFDGNIEYWVCYDCEQVWQDEALTQLTNIKNVVLPATGSENLEHVEAVAATCYTDGNVEYWYCPDCEGFWTNEACTQLTNSKSVILPMIGHGNKVHFEAVEPGCHYNGNVEYWYCPDCEGFWTDEALTQVTNSKSVILPATGEGNVVHMEAIEPGCHMDGQIEYWVCYDCEQVWQDEALTQLTNIKNVVVPATGSENLEHVEAVAATCYTDGNVEYWYCPDCEGFWTNEACTQLTNSKNIILPMIGHANKIHFDAVEPGCHYLGNVEYWFCPDCEGFWTDEALTQVTNSKSVILPEAGGEVIHVEAKAPTATENGNIEYWYCEECEQVWQDEARTQLTNFKNVILPATGETAEEPDAPEAGETPEKAPETGDSMPVVLMVSMLLVAVACVGFGLKKRNA